MKLNIRGSHNKDSYGWDRDCLKLPRGLGCTKIHWLHSPCYKSLPVHSAGSMGQSRGLSRRVCLLSEVARGEERFLRAQARKRSGEYPLFGLFCRVPRILLKVLKEPRNITD